MYSIHHFEFSQPSFWAQYWLFSSFEIARYRFLRPIYLTHPFILYFSSLFISYPMPKKSTSHQNRLNLAPRHTHLYRVLTAWSLCTCSQTSHQYLRQADWRIGLSPRHKEHWQTPSLSRSQHSTSWEGFTSQAEHAKLTWENWICESCQCWWTRAIASMGDKDWRRADSWVWSDAHKWLY